MYNFHLLKKEVGKYIVSCFTIYAIMHAEGGEENIRIYVHK